MRILLSIIVLSMLSAPAAPQTASPEPQASPIISPQASPIIGPQATPNSEPPTESIPRAWLVIAPVDASGRRPFRPDAVFARHLLAADATPPVKDEKQKGELGKEGAWEERSAKADGTLEGEIGYAYTAIESPIRRVMLAQLSGASRLFVNGVGFAGDLYAYGFGGIPIELAKGRNDLFVTGVRGSVRLRLEAPKRPVVFGGWDSTLPDLIVGELSSVKDASVLVMNASSDAITFGLSSDDEQSLLLDTVEAIRLDPLCVRKLPVRILPRDVPTDPGTIELPFTLSIEGVAEDEGEEESLSLHLEPRGSAYRKTFISGIDGSVQECAVLPPTLESKETPRIVLTLHGAGVNAFGHVHAYSQKPDFMLIAPTNRRPFGFDWQDWGRTDAYEALHAALMPNVFEGEQVYLTGHSMGGHGTWHLAANDPDRFIAIAPSAGWASFDTYGGRPDGALRELWRAADGTSRTLDLISNLKELPTFILHGTADDNVPVKEARDMEAALVAAGAKPLAHYQEGAGHWWDVDTAPGTDCVDWPGIFALFRSTPRAPLPTSIEFTSVDPAIDSIHHWIQVLQPLEYGRLIHVKAKWDKENASFEIETDNVRRFRLIAPADWEPRSCKIDGASVAFEPTRSSLEISNRALRDYSTPAFVRRDGQWTFDEALARTSDSSAHENARIALIAEKSPWNSGPFKRAFDRRFTLVFGTAGNALENKELFERARSDAETWWYRANGTPGFESDVEWLAEQRGEHPAAHNVILYGNASTNAAWTWVFGKSCPVQVARGTMKLGDREWKGDSLAAVFVYPYVVGCADDQVACLAGAFADTGVAGTRLGYTLAPFTSGVGYPDYALFGAEVLTEGDGGVLAAGWFDYAWKLDGHGYVRAEPTAAEKKQ